MTHCNYCNLTIPDEADYGGKIDGQAVCADCYLLVEDDVYRQIPVREDDE